MKKILLQIGVVLLLQMITISNATAQVEKVQTTVEEFVWEDGNLLVKIKLDLSGVDLASNQGVEYTPIFSNDDKEIALPSVMLMGRESFKKHERSLAIMNDKKLEDYSKPHIIVKDFSDNTKIVNYEYTLACDEPNAAYKLKLSSRAFGCGEFIFADLGDLVEVSPKAMVAPPLIPYFESIKIDKKLVGTEETGDEFKIYFRYDRYDIDPNYMGNSVSLSHVKGFMDEIQSIKDTTLAKIVIGGFSSIEGTYEYNEALSLKRANAINNYVFKDSKIDPSIIELYNGVENWDDLRKMIVASDMKNKAEVLDVIDNNSIENRDDKLKALDSGVSYKYLKDNFFAELRHSSYIKVYRVYDDKEGKLINKGIEFMNAKEYNKALEILTTVSSDKRAHNAIGVCYMMLGDIETANSYIQQSATQGNKNAQKNLDQIELQKTIQKTK